MTDRDIIEQVFRADGVIPVTVESVGSLSREVGRLTAELARADRRYSTAVGSRLEWRHSAETHEREVQRLSSELSECRASCAATSNSYLERAERAEDREQVLVKALEPFAAVAESDIGLDESDNDIFRPMSSYARAPRITVGDLRRAAAALSDGGGKNG